MRRSKSRPSGRSLGRSVGRSFLRFVPVLGLLAVGVAGMNGSISLPSLGGASQVSASTYDAMSVTLKDGSSRVVRWNGCQDTITYKVNVSGVAVGDRAATVRTVRASFRKLSAINGVSYTYRGATSFVPTKSDMKDAPAEIVVAAVDPAQTDFRFEGDTLGVGGVLWNSWKDPAGVSQVAAVRGYVLLNAQSLPGLKPGFGVGHTVGNLVQHELGHVMGLEHVDSVKNLMDADLSSTSPDGYGPGDRRGLRALGAQAGCLSIPATASADLS